jgi:hypothetical protein
MKRLFGIQYQAADFFIVPPGSAAFSRMATLAPSLAALSAAGKPPAPAPTTTTSKVSSHVTPAASTILRLRIIAPPPGRELDMSHDADADCGQHEPAFWCRHRAALPLLSRWPFCSAATLRVNSR